MPCFPAPGTVTICEINRDLITAEALSDARAKETYGKVLGVVFSPIPFQSDLSLPDPEQETGQEAADSVSATGVNALYRIIGDTFKRIFSHKIYKDVKWFAKLDVQGVSWHPHKNILAFISGINQVTIHDYDDAEGKDHVILTSELLGDVKALEWRPNSGRMLAVACKRGICIWSASYPGNAASVRSGILSVAAMSRGSGVRWTLVDLLCSTVVDTQIIALSWSPNGSLLASASSESSSFTIWDVAQGIGTPIRRGFGNISILKWSPLGDYFFTAKTDGTFYLWETNTWTSERWSSIGGNVTSATWDPNGQMILMAFSESMTLGSIHFSSRPPSLDAHLLPVELPELSSIGSNGIEKIAWDASAERLAVSYKGGNEMYNGLIAIYDIRRSPLVSASLVGFIRGPGEKTRPLAFAFQDKFKQGPLLSVCWSSGWCCTYPLMFKSHLLP